MKPVAHHDLWQAILDSKGKVKKDYQILKFCNDDEYGFYVLNADKLIGERVYNRNSAESISFLNLG